MKQKIIFTALPNGINQDTKTAKLSVAISPQVIEIPAHTRLADVPDMRKWASLISEASFIVQVNGKTVNATKISPAADSQLWTNLFGDTLNVEPFIQEDLSGTAILSYPAKHIAAQVKLMVDQIGKQFGSDMPDAAFYKDNPLFTAISNYDVLPLPAEGTPTLASIVSDKRRGAQLKALYRTNRFVGFSRRADPSMDFAQACNFHGLFDAKPVVNVKPFSKPDFEFHDILSILSQYPKLMRRLGLVIDIEIPLDALLNQSNTTPTVQIFPSGLNLTSSTNIVCPSTAYDFTGNGFYTKSANGSFYDKGYVKINNRDEFTVLQIDTDGAALKLTAHIDAIQLKTANQNFSAKDLQVPDKAALAKFANEEIPRSEGLPSNRTAGIALVKNGMAGYLHARFERMNVLRDAFQTTAAPPPGVVNVNATYIAGVETLFADDVNIGYRMDVKMTDKPGEANTWHSLHLHENRYSFLDSNNTNISISDIGLDEGFIQVATSEDSLIEGPHMKLSEVIARWEGWSLAVPMPGLSLNEPAISGFKPVEDNDTEEEKKFRTPVDVSFRLNVIPVVSRGTLPRLRFGQNYDVKLRTVDMAGNSMPLNTKPENFDDAVFSNICYRRYEPVDTPFLVPGHNFINGLPKATELNFRDGESSEVMVIRSNEAQPVVLYEAEPAHIYKAQPGIAGQPAIVAQHGAYRDDCTRHVKPPRTTVGMAITHGILEQAALEGISNGDVYAAIIKDKDPLIVSEAFALDPVTKKDIIKSNTTLQAPVLDSFQASIPVEYLADPMAAGVVFFLSASDPNPKGSFLNSNDFTTQCSFYFDDEVKTKSGTTSEPTSDADKDVSYTAWMSPKTFRIVLKEGEKVDVHWTGTVQQTLPGLKPNFIRKLEVSLPKGFILKLNYACFWRPKDILRLSGVLEMMTMNSLADNVGQRIAKGQQWLFSPYRTLTFVHAVQQPLSKTGTTSKKTLPCINNMLSSRKFGDTSAEISIDLDIHARSTGVIDIEAEWVDWIDDTTISTLSTLNTQIPTSVQKVNKVAKITHFTTGYTKDNYVFGDFSNKSIPNASKALLHQFNDTKHRFVRYKAIASTRYKEYFFHLINQSKNSKDPFPITTASVMPFEVNVLSSTRPAAPQIAYVIPIFKWEETMEKTTLTLVRTRNCGVRVYLKRPWYSSGEGEKLAVILPLKDSITMSNLGSGAEKICTTWGNDPTKSAPQANSIFPAKNVFKEVKKDDANNIYTKDGLTIAEPELPNAVVSILAYDVDYDAEQQLYYADIMIDMDTAYFPFVRLAVAAYQQHSVSDSESKTDCCLSTIVQADYIQVPPKRTISFTKNETSVSVSISGTLPAFIGEPGGNSLNYMHRVDLIFEVSENISTDHTIITTAGQEVANLQHIISQKEIKDSRFSYTANMEFPFSGKFRLKILEYELLPAKLTFLKPTVSMNTRLVFADVIEGIEGNNPKP